MQTIVQSSRPMILRNSSSPRSVTSVTQLPHIHRLSYSLILAHHLHHLTQSYWIRGSDDLIATCPTTLSVLDPIPSWLLKQLSHLFIPVICNLCNLSLQSGIFPSSHSRAVVPVLVVPRLKKPTLDPDSLDQFWQFISANIKPFVSIHLAQRMWSESINVTDGQTDRQTPHNCNTVPCYSVGG